MHDPRLIRRQALLLAGFALLAGAACGGSPEAADDQPAEDSSPSGLPTTGPGAPASAVASRAPTRVDTIHVEGRATSVEERLFTWEGAGALPMSVYIGDDWAVDTSADGAGAAVRFLANFTGVPDTAAYVHVYAHPVGTSEQRAREFVQGVLTGLQVPVSQGEDAAGLSAGPVERFAWAEAERTFQIPPTGRPQSFGALGFGRHGDRFFHVLYRYPPEYGDGMGPRIGALLRSWRWEDTGAMLRTESH